MLSIVFLSSRTFPGHEYAIRTLRTAGVIAAIVLAVRGAELLEKVLDQERDIVAALAQRRKLDADDLEPVIKVLAKLPLGDRVGQVAVGRRDQPDVDLDRLVRAHPHDLAGFEHPEQLDLDRRRHVADLVQEKRAAVGVLEPADAVSVGAGERPLHVAEELALQDVLAKARRS